MFSQAIPTIPSVLFNPLSCLKCPICLYRALHIKMSACDSQVPTRTTTPEPTALLFASGYLFGKAWAEIGFTGKMGKSNPHRYMLRHLASHRQGGAVASTVPTVTDPLWAMTEDQPFLVTLTLHHSPFLTRVASRGTTVRIQSVLWVPVMRARKSQQG